MSIDLQPTSGPPRVFPYERIRRRVPSPIRRVLGEELRALRRWKEAEEVADLAAIARPYTMVPEVRLISLAQQVRFILRERIPGDFVECGVWRGGASFLMAEMLRRAGARDRRVWMFDSFEGLPNPEPVDGEHALNWAKSWPEGERGNTASIEDVQSSVDRLGLGDYVTLVKGWFDQSLPQARHSIEKIALLRIDGDWHSSVSCCLENLYDLVVPGGFVVLDDYYAFEGCATATHEFLGARHLNHRLVTVANPWGVSDFAFFRKI